MAFSWPFCRSAMYLNQTQPALVKTLEPGQLNVTLFQVNSTGTSAVGLIRYTNNVVLVDSGRLIEADFAWDLSGITPTSSFAISLFCSQDHHFSCSGFSHL